ncbi:hypothetical protein HYDPIDRAFT_114941 [Hydnomerulius pinastri MD-312]|uniref:Fungal-type protein kinase domain-containing protein n=1 Tax=Hydnomerulius pinastri MD-312 TaxID=994086 RepID=A0A0C9W5R4_9AGAM|nr:hypothetical protein HYDPIDRAFT_114941 [Hydnomerulius pinastri MD-312]
MSNLPIVKIVLELQSEDRPRVRNAPMVLVTTKLLPITDLHGEALLVACRQCVLCHYELWNAGMQDWEISCENLMYYERDGKIIGVLHDFDLLTFKNWTRCPLPRPGTLHFMPIDLLGTGGCRVPHMYQHDLESFIWVLTWISLQFSGGVRQNPGLLDHWLKADPMICEARKVRFLCSFSTYTPPSGNDGIWHVAKNSLHVLLRRFRQLDQLMGDLNDAFENQQDATSLRAKLVEHRAPAPATVFAEFAGALGLQVEQ